MTFVCSLARSFLFGDRLRQISLQAVDPNSVRAFPAALNDLTYFVELKENGVRRYTAAVDRRRRGSPPDKRHPG